MTEIRICPEDNLAVIRSSADTYDRLLDAAEEAFDSWRDDENIFYKIKLSDLMTAIKKLVET